MKPKFFATAALFRLWLETNHATGGELIVGLYKKAARPSGMTYQEALDEALAYGWIDGVRRTLDEERWTIRFTPRRPRSIWSRVNIKRVNELIALGRMRPTGLRAFEAREAKRSGIYLYERQPATFDPANAKRLAANVRAHKFFDAQPPGYRQHVTKWIMSAKKEETRVRRLDRLIQVSARGERIDFMKPQR